MTPTETTLRWSHRSTPSSNHLTGRLSLISDQGLCRCVHRTELTNSGSEGWVFESLRAPKQAGPWRAEGLATASDVPAGPARLWV